VANDENPKTKRADAGGTPDVDAPTTPPPAEPPAPQGLTAAAELAAPDTGDDDVFSRERLLARDGEIIAGAERHIIVAALYNDDREEFTRADVRALIDEYMKRPDESTLAQEA
jgi:hypothetical protein